MAGLWLAASPFRTQTKATMSAADRNAVNLEDQMMKVAPTIWITRPRLLSTRAACG